MELHGGSVAVESQVGEGSRFTISFPWRVTDVLEQLTEGDLPESTPFLAPWRDIVIVDDSQATQEQLRRYFAEITPTIRVFSESHAVLASLLAQPPDLVVLDIFLPDGSGLDLLETLRNNPQTAELPILVVSVLDDQARAMAAGADHCLVKPFTKAQVHRALQTIALKREARLSQNGDSAQPLVLLAEDHEANVITFSKYLTAKGFDLILARNGLEVVARAKANKPDIILMDIQMPQMNGLEAIQKIREDEDTVVAQIPSSPLPLLPCREMKKLV